MPDTTAIDIASGGLLESDDEGALRIAVIHRDRYEDWTLPKGHPEEGETIEQAAIREVEEETGSRGEIIEIVPPIAYLANRQPKIVVFYRMALVERKEFTPNEEVSELRWIAPSEASGLLTYGIERRLIADVYGV